MTTPVRIQRKRTKGWRMPENTVYVGRPTMWGNPIAVTETCPAEKAASIYRNILKRWSQTKIASCIVTRDGKSAVMEGLGFLIWRNTVLKRLEELRGKNLACWCSLDQPCHADVLLELANNP